MHNIRKSDKKLFATAPMTGLAAIAAVLLLAPSSASAQEGSDEEAGSAGGVADIVVTANKRSEAASKVAGAVSAVTGEALAERSAVSLQDYLAFLPGVTLDSGENIGEGSLQIRHRDAKYRLVGFHLY